MFIVVLDWRYRIIAKIKSTLDIKGVRYVDVLAFTSKLEQIEDDKLKSFIESDANRIREQIEIWNRHTYESNFARNFKKLFVRCKDFYEDEIDEESRKLTRLNTSITKLAAEDIEAEILEASRGILDDVAVLESRFDIKKEDNTPLVICLSLPNKRQGYFQVVKDVQRVLNMRIQTITLGALLVLLWNGKVADFSTISFYADFDDMSIRDDVEKILGRSVNVSNSYLGIFEPEK